MDPITGTKLFHYGVDLRGGYDTVVISSAPGKVIFADWKGGSGRKVVVQHRDGFRTSYSHLSKIVVVPGVSVRAGQPLGLVGSSGHSTGPHLHFEVAHYSSRLDPLEVLAFA